MAEEQKDIWLNQSYDALKESISDFDKNLLYITSGALGISFAFIEKIVPLCCAVHKEYLMASWAILAFTILLTLGGNYVSVIFIDASIRNYDSNATNRSYSQKEKLFNTIIHFINILSVITLIAGIALTVIFVYKNI